MHEDILNELDHARQAVISGQLGEAWLTLKHVMTMLEATDKDEND